MASVRELVQWPVIQAPMGGGPSCPALAAAVSNAGGLGFLAAGYKTADEVAAEITETRRLTDAPFGVNVFVPHRPHVDDAALDRYLAELEPEATSRGVSLGPRAWSDDDWSAKLALLVRDPVPVVSFAFGCPDRDVISELQRLGSRVVVTITTPRDTARATAAGVDAICVQGIEAGAHRGGFSDDERDDGYGLLALVGAVRAQTDTPLIAAGALMDGRDVAAALVAGAEAAQLGTAFLRSPESGAAETYKAALQDPQFERTEITRAFSGRRARGLVNRFMIEHPDAPSAYPQINSATRPLRADAARRGDPHGMSLWAGQGYARAEARAASEIVERIAAAVTERDVLRGRP
jgi:nitronate monooxygenase